MEKLKLSSQLVCVDDHRYVSCVGPEMKKQTNKLINIEELKEKHAIPEKEMYGCFS